MDDLVMNEKRETGFSRDRRIEDEKEGEDGTDGVPLVSVDDTAHRVEAVEHGLRADEDRVVEFWCSEE